MQTRKLILIAVLIALFSATDVCSQVILSTKHFEKNGLEFDYPADWKISAGSTEDTEFAELATENKTVQLVVQWQFGAVLGCEFEGMRKRITQELADRVALQIHATPAFEASSQKPKFGSLNADQIQLHGQMNNTAVAADVYSLFVKRYFLTLVYLRVANDESGNSAWKTIQTTLKVAAPVSLEKGTRPSEGGVLNGRAIRLPRPEYPSVAKARHAGGVVVVEVLIDERGNVIGACAVSGHEALVRVSEAAAREAKFSPTKLSGKPVRVIGVITYNFLGIRPL
jgi:TonB family protein